LLTDTTYNVKHESWPLDKFKPYDKNPRKNNSVVNKMTRLISEYGFIVPMIVKSDGTLIDGHLRLKAAKELGLEKIPVYIVDHLTDKQVKAFRIAVNKTVEMASWDIDLLKGELDDLALCEFDISLTGFDDQALKDFELATSLGALDSNDMLITPIVDIAIGHDNDRIKDRDPDSDNITDTESDIDELDGGQTLINSNKSIQEGQKSDDKCYLDIVVNKSDFKRWQDYKVSIDVKADSKAFLALFNAVYR
jgi:ParB-like chromosome segregation protein Spo0J